MKFQDRIAKIPFGGDYNPEQWPEEQWDRDMELLRKAGVDMVTLNVFNWAMLQPEEETYDLSLLDRIVERVTGAGMQICMATGTGAHPAWMAKRHPDILRTEFNGMRRKFGGRHNSCPNSPTFRRFAPMLAEKVAEHYKDQKNILLWHVGNEYGGACYCENCEQAFRVWLRKKYGSLEKLNQEWNTHFWGHTFYDWDEIVAPNLLSEHFEETRSMHQGLTLDYMRFNSDSMLENFLAEKAAIKGVLPDAVVTTNLMGAYKPLDYMKWAKHMDIVSWDNYPEYKAEPAMAAMMHDLMRGVKGGEPFLLMEQTPSVSNWQKENGLKRPGVMRLQSYQAVAHGADSVLFFQMHRSPAGCEKFHGALIDHEGQGRSRVYRECRELGQEIEGLGGEFLGSRVRADVGLMFDWDTWWALECSAGPSTRLRYLDEIYCYYKGLHSQNIPVDILGMDAEFSGCKVILAPLFYMIKGDVDERLEEFVSKGGTLVLTYMSGYVNENDYITAGGYPGRLKGLTGVWVEETDALPPEDVNAFVWEGKRYEAGLLCDIIHPEGAEPLSFYEKDFYAGSPVITKNRYGDGVVYYVGTRSGEAFYEDFLGKVCGERGIGPVIPETRGLEVTVREGAGARYVFVLNHGKEKREFHVPFDALELISGAELRAGVEVCARPGDVLILKERRL